MNNKKPENYSPPSQFSARFPVVKLNHISLFITGVLALAIPAGAWAQSGYASPQFTPPTLRKPPVSGMLTLTPTTVQPQVISLSPQTITPQQAIKPAEVQRNEVPAPASTTHQTIATQSSKIATTTPEQKPTGIWAPSTATNWLAVQRQSVTSVLDQPPTPSGLGNAAPEEPDVDWRVVTPVDVPMIFVPLANSQPKPQPNFWNAPANPGPKTPKYEWK